MNSVIDIYKSPSGLVQCTIKSQGCKYKLNGKGCIMCNYGADRNVKVEELEYSLDKFVRPIVKNRVLFGTYGSILDESEINKELFDTIINFIKSIDTPIIIFETHYKTINQRTLQYVSEAIPNKEVIFEVGLESSNEDSILNIGKDINLEELKHTINLVHKYNMEVSTNILVGVPFKNTKEQLLDALETIHWSFSNKVDSVVLFPLNIKLETKLQYNKPVSSWLIVETLLNIGKDKLDKVHIAWYGNRENNNSIKPLTCNKCEGTLMSFYKQYEFNRDAKTRSELLQKLLNSTCECKCQTKVIDSIYN